MFPKQNRFDSSANFNPGPNIYQLPHSFSSKNKQILTGSLKGPSQSTNTLGSFGGVKRFSYRQQKQKQKLKHLGPGTYNYNNNIYSIKIHEKQLKKQIEFDINNKNTNANKRNRSISNIKSKLASSSTQNALIDRNENKLYIGKPMEQVQYQYTHQSQENKPGFSFPKSVYRQRQILQNKHQQEYEEQNAPQYNQQQLQSIMKIKSQNKRRKLQLIQMIVKKQVPRLNALNIQYNKKNEDKTTPGPGSYNPILNIADDYNQNGVFKSKTSKSQSLFQNNDKSASKRGPGSYNIMEMNSGNQMNKNGKGYCFNREERKTSLIDERDLPYEFYEKQQKLIKKSYNKPNHNYLTPFGSGTSRFQQSTKQSINYNEIKSKSMSALKLQSRQKERYKIKSSLNYLNKESSHKQRNKPLQNIQILTDFYRNRQ